MITYPNVKVNLGLNVLRKRNDGYHDLETLFVPYFGIHDVLEIVAGDDYSRTSASLFAKYSDGFVSLGGSAVEKIAQAVSSDGKVMITIAKGDGVDWNPLDDLTVRAYRLLDADYDLPPVKIFLEKLSPVGAGLGGGSADASFALSMINQMFMLGLDEGVLASYASRLGSDCAFFIYNRPMVGEGRGEILSDYALKDIRLGTNADESGTANSGSDCRYELKVIAPQGIKVSTADAYRGIRPHEPEIPLREALAKPLSQWKNVLVNAFEETVFASYPELSAIKRSLYDSGAVYASMSGSGSALFAIYDKKVI